MFQFHSKYSKTVTVGCKVKAAVLHFSVCGGSLGITDAVADEAVECVMIAVCAVVGLFLLILGHTYLRTGTLFLPALN